MLSFLYHFIGDCAIKIKVPANEVVAVAQKLTESENIYFKKVSKLHL